ncbi:MAG TPA: hypothetical protein VG328_05045 [Stellaceae bacterium]|jgi:hypothetical protein|nr:hypothetical protein [Stellaceae bacterium]
MWKIWTEWHYGELAPEEPNSINFLAAKFVAVKDDGTRIREGHGGRERDDLDGFLYEASDVSFPFSAFRYDRSHEDTRVYRVYFGVSMPAMINVERARAIACNIREALLLLPASWVRYDNLRPIDVIFDMHFWNKRHPESPIHGNFP